MSNETTLTDVQSGHQYRLRHSRFGRADVRVTYVDAEWIDVVVTHGVLRGMGRGAVWEVGDEKRVRREHCHFTPIEEPAK